MTVAYQNGVIFTTVATASYLPQAMVMAKSIKKQMPGCKVIVCLVEEKMPDAVKNSSFDEVILAKNLGFSNFNRFIFQYNQFEGANACKAQLLIYLLRTYQKHDYFIFLDSDTKAFGPFDEMIEYLTENEIIISPHFIHVNPKKPFYYLEIIQRSGIFNTGLFAIKRGGRSERFLRWWADLLLKYCYKDSQKGLWNEQKWLDLALGPFDFYIQKDPGYNVGPWNFHERLLTLTDNGSYLVNGRPLRLFHFSGLFSGYYNKRLEKVDPGQRSLIGRITEEYRGEVAEAGRDRFKTKEWSYNRFLRGHTIKKRSKLIFKNYSRLFKDIDNPFLKSNQYFRSNFVQYLKNKNDKR